MRLLIIAAFMFVIPLSCEKEKSTDCYQAEPVAGWMTENFKSNYTIQTPPNYEGFGMIGFEGNTFFKNAPDSSVRMVYFYCSPVFCEDFGDTLAEPLPSSISTLGFDPGIYFLDEQIEICKNDSIIAVLYHDNESLSHAKLYMDFESQWREALYLEYEDSRYEQVLGIIGSINEK